MGYTNVDIGDKDRLIALDIGVKKRIVDIKNLA